MSRLSDRYGRITASLEPHTLVVGALKVTRTQELGDMGYAEPLDALSRSLDDEARLTPAGRRAAKAHVIDLLAARASVDTSTGTGPPPIVVCGLPGSGAGDVAKRLGDHPGLTRPPRPLDEVDLRSMTFEYRWHVPAYAEWLTGSDPTGHLAWVRSATAVGEARSVVGSWLDAERLPAVRAAWPDCTIIVVRSGDRSASELATSVAAGCVAARAASGSRAEADVIERYWRWRVGTIAVRLDEAADLIDAECGPDVDIDGLVTTLT